MLIDRSVNQSSFNEDVGLDMSVVIAKFKNV